MPGIIFLRTANLKATIEFYVSRLGMKVWIEQEGCTILSHGSFFLGFCQGETPETNGVITLFYERKEEVDKMYSELKDIATSEPIGNSRYKIYQFYANDPEGRTLEFQTFLHKLRPVSLEEFLSGS
jgi:catechol 2,3-dioxygenase-like lactoylglutathione lyase family enzyme